MTTQDDTLPEYPMTRPTRGEPMSSRAKAAVLITAIITFGFVLMTFSPNAKAATGAATSAVAPSAANGATTSYTPPKCQEDETILWFGKCGAVDDSHFRGGYWFNHPNGRVTRATNVPQCREDQVIVRSGRCRALDRAFFHPSGYWFAR